MKANGVRGDKDRSDISDPLSASESDPQLESLFRPRRNLHSHRKPKSYIIVNDGELYYQFNDPSFFRWV